MMSAYRSVVAGPISKAIVLSGTIPTPTMKVSTDDESCDATTRSTGRWITVPAWDASLRIARAVDTDVASTNDNPILYPCARRKVFAIAPPISR